MTVVLKLGGSVITEKDEPETVADEQLEALAATIGESGLSDIAVVHGAGSFGHHHADAHGVSDTDGTHDAEAVRDIAGTMERLNDAVVAALAEAGVPVVPVHPFAAGYRTADGDLQFPTDQIGAMLAEGFVPVVHGDILTQVEKGATILSGDELVTTLASAFDADRVGLCSTVPGVFDESGDVVDVIESYDDVSAALGESEATDVTGGMAGKVRALLELESSAFVFGPGALDAFLAGEDAGTRIDGESR